MSQKFVIDVVGFVVAFMNKETIYRVLPNHMITLRSIFGSFFDQTFLMLGTESRFGPAVTEFVLVIAYCGSQRANKQFKTSQPD